MAVWIILGGNGPGNAEREFLATGPIGIGFYIEGDIRGLSRERVRLRTQAGYLRYLRDEGIDARVWRLQGTVTWFLHQVLNFRDTVRIGDTIIMPRKASGGRRIAHDTVAGRYRFTPRARYPHRRRINWIDQDLRPHEIATLYPFYEPQSDNRTVIRIER